MELLHMLALMKTSQYLFVWWRELQKAQSDKIINIKSHFTCHKYQILPALLKIQLLHRSHIFVLAVVALKIKLMFLQKPYVLDIWRFNHILTEKIPCYL